MNQMAFPCCKNFTDYCSLDSTGRFVVTQGQGRCAGPAASKNVASISKNIASGTLVCGAIFVLYRDQSIQDAKARFGF